MSKSQTKRRSAKVKVNLVPFLKPYSGLVILCIILVIAANGISLILPRQVGILIDKFVKNTSYQPNDEIILLIIIVIAIFVLTVAQTICSNYTSEKIAKDLRSQLVAKISNQSVNYVFTTGSNNLLVNITSDVNSAKTIVSQGIVNALSALVLLVGSIIAILLTNWELGLIAVGILPLIVIVYILIFGRIIPLFTNAQVILGKINKVVSESIVGSTLVRVLNSQTTESAKFAAVNTEARNNGYGIINLFSALIPAINLIYNLAVISVLYFGGVQIVGGSLSLGELSAFITYFGLLITPIFILGFTSQQITQGLISLGRINTVLNAEVKNEFQGQHRADIKGEIIFDKINLELNNKPVLKNVSFTIKPGTRTAILGPTAAGKTQIFNLITGLFQPDSGTITMDRINLNDWSKASFLNQVGLVFQESIIFNSSWRENLAFSDKVTDESLTKAIETADLSSLVESLPQGLETKISERGSDLSGGQKQRLMLARALAIEPKVLLLDDFTARVDIATEKRILDALIKNYPDITLISITQKVDPIKDYDQIIVVMEGEVLGSGTHEELLIKSSEYNLIIDSQQSVDEE